jgi:alpha-galactosidase
MNRKSLFAAVTLIAAALMGIPQASAAEKFDTDPKHQLPKPDTKPADIAKPVKVFILMGQSNMLGMGDVGPETTKGTLECLTKTEKRYPHLVDDAGNWTVRSDVRHVFVMHNRGNMQTVQNDWLTVKGRTIGPELQFGHIMGHVLDEPVLVLKTCIGNRSLGWDLLPPGSERFTFEGKTYAGYKDDTPSWVEGEEKKPVPWYAGKQYDDDTANAKKVLSELGKYYPGAEKYEIAGFVWWQGHKDQNPAHASRYEQNLVHLIKTLREDFKAPNAPFVLATIGFDGWKLAGPGLTIANAQLAVGDPKKHPEFAGNVKCVESRDFWREVEVSPKNQGYHYNRNAETYMEVGNALGWAMADLLNKHDQ